MSAPPAKTRSAQAARDAHGADDHRHAHDHPHGHEHAHPHHAHAHHGPRRPAPADALIRAEGLTVERGGRLLLQSVDIDVSAGEIVTLIGPNGAGKTTLVRLLLGLMRADAGRIVRRPGLVIGYVPQRFDRDQAIPITVERFMRLGSAATPAAIARVLAEVGGDQLERRQLFHLSGGEVQRVLLARALLRGPQLLVLDEPVRGVDYTGEAEMYELISRLRSERNLGVLLVSHDLHVVMARSDRVVCINQHVCCEGQPERVAGDPAYRRLFGPLATDALAVYRHRHDHGHDLAGRPVPLGDEAATDKD